MHFAPAVVSIFYVPIRFYETVVMNHFTFKKFNELSHSLPYVNSNNN